MERGDAFDSELYHIARHLVRLAAERPRCRRVAVGIDLADDWPKALCSQGFISSERTAWLVEGLLQYIDAPAVDTLFARIDALSAPGSVVLYNVIGETLIHEIGHYFGLSDDDMERIEMLREQAKILRNIAARSTQLYGIYAKLLALAHQCDELAETLAETLSTEGGHRQAAPRLGHYRLILC